MIGTSAAIFRWQVENDHIQPSRMACINLPVRLRRTPLGPGTQPGASSRHVGEALSSGIRPSPARDGRRGGGETHATITS